MQSALVIQIHPSKYIMGLSYCIFFHRCCESGSEPPTQEMRRQKMAVAVKCHYKSLIEKFYLLLCLSAQADGLVNLRRLEREMTGLLVNGESNQRRERVFF